MHGPTKGRYSKALNTNVEKIVALLTGATGFTTGLAITNWIGTTLHWTAQVMIVLIVTIAFVMSHLEFARMIGMQIRERKAAGDSVWLNNGGFAPNLAILFPIFFIFGLIFISTYASFSFLTSENLKSEMASSEYLGIVASAEALEADAADLKAQAESYDKDRYRTKRSQLLSKAADKNSEAAAIRSSLPSFAKGRSSATAGNSAFAMRLGIEQDLWSDIVNAFFSLMIDGILTFLVIYIEFYEIKTSRSPTPKKRRDITSDRPMKRSGTGRQRHERQPGRGAVTARETRPVRSERKERVPDRVRQSRARNVSAPARAPQSHRASVPKEKVDFGASTDKMKEIMRMTEDGFGPAQIMPAVGCKKGHVSTVRRIWGIVKEMGGDMEATFNALKPNDQTKFDRARNTYADFYTEWTNGVGESEDEPARKPEIIQFKEAAQKVESRNRSKRQRIVDYLEMNPQASLQDISNHLEINDNELVRKITQEMGRSDTYSRFNRSSQE